MSATPQPDSATTTPPPIEDLESPPLAGQSEVNSHEPVLPSGAVVRLRPMTLREQKLLAEQRNTKEPTRLFMRLVQSCCIGLADPGPYQGDDIQGNRLVWGRALQGDMMDAARHIRVLTHKAKYTFPYQCPGCNSEQKATVNLLDDLDVVEFDDENHARFANGEPFETEHQSRKFWFKTLRINDEIKMQRHLNDGDDSMMTFFMMRLVRVEGFEDEKNPHYAWRKWLESQHLGDLQDLFHAILNVDPGLDTTVRPICPNKLCGYETEIELPFLTISFFLGERTMQKVGSKRRRGRKTKARGRALGLG